ncbi:hypothetical protein [Floricoccus penangensis]|uniref:hypothetical protein n=1 Tax=Floricoccus penangensis TaxID=1859475 RepID=UPI00203FF9AF|nr:hypothetical protein [Floricoccus penangensis]URZ87139.1 hypothetical protein KIW23_08645 [Floricoccus penangensis]
MTYKKNNEASNDDFAKEFDEIFGFSSEDLKRVPPKRELEHNNGKINEESKNKFVNQRKDKNFKNYTFSKSVSKVNNRTIYIFIFVIIIAILIFNKQNSSKKPIGRLNENISETTGNKKGMNNSSDKKSFERIEKVDTERAVKEGQVLVVGEKKFFPLNGVLSKPTKEASKTDNFYVFQEGKTFNFSNGFQLNVIGYNRLSMKSEPTIVHPVTDYDNYANFLSYDFDLKYEEFRIRTIIVDGIMSNDILKSYYFQNYGNESQIYKTFDVEKHEDYEAVYIYRQKIFEHGDVNYIDKVYCFNDGSGISLSSCYYDTGGSHSKNEKIIDVYSLDKQKEIFAKSFELIKSNANK